MINDQEQEAGCQDGECKHASDCAVHNEPAEPAGECDCGWEPQVITSQDVGSVEDLLGGSTQEPEARTNERTGIYHPAQPLLDQIDIASSFNTPDCGQRIRVLVAQVRKLL